MTHIPLRPQHSYYLVQLLPPPLQTDSGLHLPEEYQQADEDGEVLACGPGSVLANGLRWPMQCGCGDRVIADRQSFRWVDERERLAFIHDGDVVARVVEDQLTPANDWVFVLPDPREAATPQGVLVAHTSARGGDARDGERGEMLLRELEGRLRLMDHLAEPERVAYVQRYAASLPPADLERLREAKQRRNRGERWRPEPAPPVTVEPRLSGRVLAVGPGRVALKGPGLGRRAVVPTSLLHTRVFWDRNHREVSLFDGERALLAVPVGDLCAVSE